MCKTVNSLPHPRVDVNNRIDHSANETKKMKNAKRKTDQQETPNRTTKLAHLVSKNPVKKLAAEANATGSALPLMMISNFSAVLIQQKTQH